MALEGLLKGSIYLSWVGIVNQFEATVTKRSGNLFCPLFNTIPNEKMSSSNSDETFF